MEVEDPCQVYSFMILLLGGVVCFCSLVVCFAELDALLHHPSGSFARGAWTGGVWGSLCSLVFGGSVWVALPWLWFGLGAGLWVMTLDSPSWSAWVGLGLVLGDLRTHCRVTLHPSSSSSPLLGCLRVRGTGARRPALPWPGS